MSITWRKWIKEGHRCPPNLNCIHNILSCFENSCICNVQRKYWFNRRTITLGLFFHLELQTVIWRRNHKVAPKQFTIPNENCATFGASWQSLVQANAFIFYYGNKCIDSYWLMLRFIISDGEVNNFLLLFFKCIILDKNFFVQDDHFEPYNYGQTIKAKCFWVFESNRCGGGRAKSALTRVAPFLFYYNQVHISILWTT